MNSTLVKNWNDCVEENDLIIHLGDIIFQRDLSILDGLKGNKIFIKGNHDHSKTLDKLSKRYPVRDYMELEHDNNFLVMFHYPIDSWNLARRGAIHCHGHCHGTFNKYNVGRRRFDVGVDVEGYKPVLIDEICTRAQQLPVKDLREYGE